MVSIGRGVVDSMRSFAAALLCTSLACMPTVEPGEGRAGRADDREARALGAEPAELRDFEVALDGGDPRAAAEALGAVRDASPGEHATSAGWSRDGSTFAYCQSLDGCRECRFVARDGRVETLASGPGCAEDDASEILDARLAALGPSFGRGSWAHGADVVLAVQTSEDERTNAGELRPMLKVGVRSRRAALPSWLVFVDPCEGCGLDQICEGEAHLDAMVPSPNGERVAVLIHVVGNDERQELRLELLPSPSMVEAATTPASRAR